MQYLCVCVLLLAVTSSSLGTPLAKQQWEQLTKHKNDGSPGVDWELDVLNEHTGVHAMAEDNDFAPTFPNFFDWREFHYKVISDVNNQGDVLSSVAIAAQECVGSQRALQKGSLIELSDTEIQDCCTSQVRNDVFGCIHNIGGLCRIEMYPALTGHCRNRSCTSEWKIQGGKTVPAKQVSKMTEALMTTPLMVLVDTTRSSFAIYQDGIYSDPDCSSENVDRAMQVVGYGVENGTEYWICKNSWGIYWGEAGYIRILKGKDMCGIESFASYPY